MTSIEVTRLDLRRVAIASFSNGKEFTLGSKFSRRGSGVISVPHFLISSE